MNRRLSSGSTLVPKLVTGSKGDIPFSQVSVGSSSLHSTRHKIVYVYISIALARNSINTYSPIRLNTSGSNMIGVNSQADQMRCSSLWMLNTYLLLQLE